MGTLKIPVKEPMNIPLREPYRSFQSNPGPRDPFKETLKIPLKGGGSLLAQRE